MQDLNGCDLDGKRLRIERKTERSFPRNFSNDQERDRRCHVCNKIGHFARECTLNAVSRKIEQGRYQ